MSYIKNLSLLINDVPFVSPASPGYISGVTNPLLDVAGILSLKISSSANNSLLILGDGLFASGQTSASIIAALGFTPYNATNPSGYISAITSIMVTNALGFIPASGVTNPISNIGGKLGLSISAASGNVLLIEGDGLYASGITNSDGTLTVASNVISLNQNHSNTWGPVQTFNQGIIFAAGTGSIAPIVFTAGTNLSGTTAGAVEYDGTNVYFTNDTTSGLGAIPSEQRFYLNASGATSISTIANFFGANSNISLISGAYYEIDIYLWYFKATTSTVVITLANSAAPSYQDIIYEQSPIGGLVAPPGTATLLEGQVYNDATASKTITTGSITSGAEVYTHIKIFLKNGTGTSLKIQATSTSGTLVPGIGSRWICRRISPNNIGNFQS